MDDRLGWWSARVVVRSWLEVLRTYGRLGLVSTTEAALTHKSLFAFFLHPRTDGERRSDLAGPNVAVLQ
jgi:hypothetical protein